jgi:hypothetical protein
LRRLLLLLVGKTAESGGSLGDAFEAADDAVQRAVAGTVGYQLADVHEQSRAVFDESADDVCDSVAFQGVHVFAQAECGDTVRVVSRPEVPLESAVVTTVPAEGDLQHGRTKGFHVAEGQSAEGFLEKAEGLPSGGRPPVGDPGGGVSVGAVGGLSVRQDAGEDVVLAKVDALTDANLEGPVVGVVVLPGLRGKVEVVVLAEGRLVDVLQ